MSEVEIYSDGSCIGSPGPGGWAAVIVNGESVQELSGGEAETTNNRMELRAVIEGLRVLNPQCVSVYSDSQYVVNCFHRKWYVRWLRTDWKNGTVKNRDLWEELFAETSRHHRVTWHWIRGHSGHPMNERADRLAFNAIPTNTGYNGSGYTRDRVVDGRNLPPEIVSQDLIDRVFNTMGGITSRDKFVLLALAFELPWEADVLSIELLAQMTSLTVLDVRRALERLIAAGYLEAHGSTYRILVDKLAVGALYPAVHTEN